MRWMKMYIKIISVILAIVLIVGFFVPSLVLNGTVFAKESPENSTIGGIAVEELNKEEILRILRDAVEKWQETPLIISGGGTEQELDAHDVQFDIEQVVSQFEELSKKPWFAFWESKRTVQLPIPVIAGGNTKKAVKSNSQWKTEETIAGILNQAGNLGSHQINAELVDVSSLENERIAFQISDIPKNVDNLEGLLDKLNNQLIAPNQKMSLLQLLGEQANTVHTETLNFIASMVYSTILQTDYAIVERHAQAVPPSYLQQGLEAEVNVVLAKDLQFVNTSAQLSKLKATIEGNQLKIEIWSAEKDKEVTVRVTKDKIVRPRIIARYSDELAAGQEKIEQEGQEGVRIEIYRSIHVNGSSTEEQLVSRDYYAPINRIVVRSSRKLEASESVVTDQQKTATDSDLQMDLDGNGLPDANTSATEQKQDGPEIVYGYYDKGGNFVQTSP